MRKDTFLTETFYNDHISGNQALMTALNTMVEEANNESEVVSLVVEQDSGSSTIILGSKLSNNDASKLDESDAMSAILREAGMYLSILSRGAAAIIAEQIGKSYEHPTSFVKKVIEMLCSELESTSLYAKNLVNESTLRDRLFNELNKVDTENGLADEKSRVDFITAALDAPYWEGVEREAINASIRKVDAKALRIALSLNFKVLN